MRKNVIYWLVLLIFVGCVLALNYWCLPAHDELGYTFQGECTPMEGVAHHVQNLKDVIDIQIADYKHGPNGRVFLHSLVVLFSGWELYTLFDFLNTGMWFLLVFWVLQEGKVRVDSIQKFVWGTAVALLFLWYAMSCCYNSAFAVNYLWSACVTLGVVKLWRRFDAWWMVPVSFVYGWWMEVFSMPMIAAICCGGLLMWWRTKKFPWSVARFCAWFVMVLGALGCCGSHLVSGRAAQSSGQGLLAAIKGMCMAQVNLVWDVWPAVLLVCVFVVVWKCRTRLLTLYDSSPEWWMYFVWSLASYVVLGKEGLRIGYPMLVSGLVLVFQNRRHFESQRRWLDGIVVAVAFWFVAAAIFQYRVGAALDEMERVYARDPQGVTFRRSVSVGLWRNTVSIHLLGRWHRALFKHKFRHAREPVVLSPYLYDSLYLDSSKFFADAENLGGCLFVSPNEPNYVIQVGDDRLSAHEKTLLDGYWRRLDNKSGWRKYMPGRLLHMFQHSDFYMALPYSPYVISTKNGRNVCIHMKGMAK